MTSKEKLENFLKSQPVGVGCAVLVVLLGAAIYFRSDAVPEAEKLLDERSTTGERLDANIKNGAQLNDQLAAIAAAREQIEGRLIHADEMAKNLQYFYKIQADTNTKLIDLRQNQVVPPKAPLPNPKPSYISIPYVVAVRGDYPHLLEFLRRLENGTRYCRVMTASIALAGTSDKDRASEMTLNLNIELLGMP